MVAAFILPPAVHKGFKVTACSKIPLVILVAFPRLSCSSEFLKPTFISPGIM